jgi:hypothetical protein
MKKLAVSLCLFLMSSAAFADEATLMSEEGVSAINSILSCPDELKQATADGSFLGESSSSGRAMEYTRTFIFGKSRMMKSPDGKEGFPIWKNTSELQIHVVRDYDDVFHPKSTFTCTLNKY